mgnify:CR=1 FL=1
MSVKLYVLYTPTKTKFKIKEKIDWNPTVGNIMKDGEKIPFGYLAEIILQAAIVAKFVDKRDKSKKVNENDIKKFLKQFLEKSSDTQAKMEILGDISQKTKKSTTISKAFQYDVDIMKNLLL